MVMNAEELRARRDWTAELRRILRQGPSKERTSDGPAIVKRSAQAGVTLALDALQTGSGALRDAHTSDEDIRRVIFNAVDQMVDSALASYLLNWPRTTAIDEIKTQLEAQLRERDRGDGSRAIDDRWKALLNEAVEALHFEERKKSHMAGKGAAPQDYRRSMLATPEGLRAMVVDPALAADVIENLAHDDAWQNPALTANPDFVDTLRKVHAAKGASPAAKAAISARMLERPDGRAALATNTVFGGALLADRSPEQLRNLDFDAQFPEAKGRLASEALLETISRAIDGPLDQPRVFDREYVDALLPHIDAATANEHVRGKRDLGPRLNQSLWRAKEFDAIATLIDRGVDTRRAARADGAIGKGVYSGFVQPIQHVVSKILLNIDDVDRAAEKSVARFEKIRALAAARIDELPTHEKAHEWQEALSAADELARGGEHVEALTGIRRLSSSLSMNGPSDEAGKAFQTRYTAQITDAKAPATQAEIEGAKTLIAALKRREDAGLPGGPVSLTDWTAVTGSDMLKAFKDDPGTIWGFEDIRMPFVQAGHETQLAEHREAGPLRMMEIWDAVKQSFPPRAYEQMLSDPEAAVETFINLGLGAAKSRKLAEGVDNQQFVQNFKKEARSFFLEFAAQMPRGLLTGNFDAPTDQRTDKLRTSDVMGLDQDKYLSTYACKVGLAWAKAQDKPVYYCLDGIEMADVVNYKTVKNQAIADFIDAGGAAEGGQAFSEVVTMQELREILKKWDQLKRRDGSNLVKFFIKGKALDGEALEAELIKWKTAMDDADSHAGRPAAPPKDTFAHRLDALDAGLRARIPATPDGDKDARDIVKKSAYLAKVARTRPSIVLLYLESRCTVLKNYGLVSPELAAAAAAFAKLDDLEHPPVKPAEELRRNLTDEIAKCHASFRAALTASLVTALEAGRMGR